MSNLFLGGTIVNGALLPSELRHGDLLPVGKKKPEKSTTRVFRVDVEVSLACTFQPEFVPLAISAQGLSSTTHLAGNRFIVKKAGYLAATENFVGDGPCPS